MVIQANMSPKAIVEIWGETEEIFHIYNIQLINSSLETVVEASELDSLLTELNSMRQS